MSTSAMRLDAGALLRELFAKTLREVDVATAVEREIAVGAGIVAVAGLECELREVRRVAIVAIGKAAGPMLEGARRALREVALDALVIAPLPPEADSGVRFLVGAHPIPDLGSRVAAEEVIAFLQAADEMTAVLFLISGGASAMLELPLDGEISIEDTAAFYRVLVGSGLPIADMNMARKHFSAVKGGRLAGYGARARAQWTLVVSDVPDGMIDAIASGPSVPDASTVADCREVLGRIKAPLPASVRKFFDDPLLAETPKSGDAIFRTSVAKEILSSRELASVAARVAEELGFYVEIENTPDEWEYRDAARFLLARSERLGREHGRSCLISVGEVAVELGEVTGRGGRNQQFALYCALRLAASGEAMTVLSAGSDGIDGESPAAGAIANGSTVMRARELGIDGERALAGFDAYPLFAALGDAVVTGPTGNNLRDLRVFLTGA